MENNFLLLVQSRSAHPEHTQKPRIRRGKSVTCQRVLEEFRSTLPDTVLNTQSVCVVSGRMSSCRRRLSRTALASLGAPPVSGHHKSRRTHSNGRSPHCLWISFPPASSSPPRLPSSTRAFCTSMNPRHAEVPGLASANLTQPQAEEKDCEVRSPQPPTQKSQGEAIFAIASVLDAWIRNTMNWNTRACLPC